MSTNLERLARRVQSDPFFLAAPLARYAASQQLDDDALALRLGCDQDILRHLRLCRNPDPLPPHFWQDIERIASAFGLDPDRLAEVVRFGQALLHAQPPADTSVLPAPGPLLAAREQDDLESPAGENPMIVPLWVAELADAFWEMAGMSEPFPRELRRPIARALQLAIVSLPELRLRDVFDWLRQNGVGCPCAAPDRNLHACLAAWKGWGYVFLNGVDAEEEQRLSLAHELAHFLRHYWHPRRQACRKLGEQVLEVLDGRRPPTPTERVHAVLASVPLGFHLHLLDRDPESRLVDETVRVAEEEADQLAYELLAPADEVLDRAGSRRGETLAELLQTDFGLPAAHALRYSTLLFPPELVDPLLLRLGLG